MYRMAAHLVFWGRAKIINIMTKNNTYILSPHNPTTSTNLPSLWREFSNAFPYFNLVEVCFDLPPLHPFLRLIRIRGVGKLLGAQATWRAREAAPVRIHSLQRLRTRRYLATSKRLDSSTPYVSFLFWFTRGDLSWGR